MPRTTLIQLLKIPPPFFQLIQALRWTDEQCRQKELERSGENRRLMLGTALFKIRVPLIKEDLTEQIGWSNKGNKCSEIKLRPIAEEKRLLKLQNFRQKSTGAKNNFYNNLIIFLK